MNRGILANVIAKLKILGRYKTHEDIVEYLLDDETSIKRYIKLDKYSSEYIRIDTTKKDLQLSDYFTSLDLGTGGYVLELSSSRSVSFRDVEIPEGLILGTIKSNFIDFGDDVDLVRLLNTGEPSLLCVTDIKSRLTFNKDKCSSKLYNMGVCPMLKKFSTESLGVTKLSVSFILESLTQSFSNTPLIDLSSVDEIISNLSDADIRVGRFGDLRTGNTKIIVRREIAYMVIQSLLLSRFTKLHTHTFNQAVAKSKPILKESGVYKAELAVENSEITFDEPKGRLYRSEAVRLMHKLLIDLELEADNYFDRLQKDKVVSIDKVVVELV